MKVTASDTPGDGHIPTTGMASLHPLPHVGRRDRLSSLLSALAADYQVEGKPVKGKFLCWAHVQSEPSWHGGGKCMCSRNQMMQRNFEACAVGAKMVIILGRYLAGERMRLDEGNLGGSRRGIG